MITFNIKLGYLANLIFLQVFKVILTRFIKKSLIFLLLYIKQHFDLYYQML